jgi:hypothetical protein
MTLPDFQRECPVRKALEMTIHDLVHQDDFPDNSTDREAFFCQHGINPDCAAHVLECAGWWSYGTTVFGGWKVLQP